MRREGRRGAAFRRAVIARLPATMFTFSCLAAAFGYGVIAERIDLFPVPQIGEAVTGLREIVNPSRNIWLTETDPGEDRIANLLPDRLQPGLVLYTGMDADSYPVVAIMDRSGKSIHEWHPDFFAIWGQEGRFSEDRRPKDRRNTYLHGLAMLPDGSIVGNFEHLSTVRLDMCGNVIWKLDNLGHHSVHIDDDGNIWVPAERAISKNPTGHRNHFAPLRGWVVEKISPDGRVLETIDVIDVLEQNDLKGLLYMSSQQNLWTAVSGDTLHLNDVETFPERLKSTRFSPGDLLVSLRNINTFLVIDPGTLRVKFRFTGPLLRQHDPDFMADDRISVFDNQNLEPSGGPDSLASRILEVDARTGEASVVISGHTEPGFFSAIMGDHQRLANGNVLVTSTLQGRVIEFLPDGSMGWRFTNRIREGEAGSVFSAEVLPPGMDRDFFESRAAQCSREGGHK